MLYNGLIESLKPGVNSKNNIYVQVALFILL